MLEIRIHNDTTPVESLNNKKGTLTSYQLRKNAALAFRKSLK